MGKQEVTDAGTDDMAGLRAMPRGPRQGGCTVWCCASHTLGWVCGPWGWESGRGASGRALAWDPWVTGLLRSVMVAGAVVSMLLVLLALVATALCVAAERGELNSCWELTLPFSSNLTKFQ